MTSPELAVARSGFSGRGYRHPLTKQIVPSVTTVLKMAAQPGLTQWAVDQTAAYAVANIDQLLTKTETQGWGSLRWYWKRNPLPLEKGYDVRNYHVGVLNDAAELGTGTHAWVEADIDPAFQYPITDFEPDEFWQMVDVWNDWRAEHTIKPVLTETTVWNASEGYAGTFDLLVEIDGELWLIDVKTSRSLWPEHLMQLSALKNATTVLLKQEDGSYIEEDWGYLVGQIQHYGFLHIRPDDIDNNGNIVPAYVELVEAEFLDDHYPWFQGLLAAKKAEIAIGQKRSALEKARKNES
jgi:hypothetical protein